MWELLYYTADEANVYRELINYYRGQCIAQRVSDIISSRWFNAWHEGSDEMVPRDNKPSTKESEQTQSNMLDEILYSNNVNVSE